MSDCSDELRLQAFHDGELPASERGAVVAHVAGCEPCGEYLASLREMSAWMAGAAAASAGISPIGLARVRRGVGAITDQGLVRFGWRLSGAAAAVLVASAGWLAWSAARPVPAAASAVAVVPPWVAVRTTAGVDPATLATATPAAAWYGVDLDGGM